MSRGLGSRQREILDRLKLVRCEHLPDLWHALSGDTTEPWPSRAYSGWFEQEVGQSLSLYGRGEPRSLRVAYRRAARLLHGSGLLEIRSSDEVGGVRIYVRLPVTEREKIAARGMRRRIAEYIRESPRFDRQVFGETRVDLERRERLQIEREKTIWYLWQLDRYPPAAEVPAAAARILRQGLSGSPQERG